jgi:enterochelin esterase-like enzyme
MPPRTPTVLDFTVNSTSLAERRGVTVYLPPGHRAASSYPVLFCADGQAVRGFAERLSEEIQSGNSPSVILIGVHSVAGYRSQEYLTGIDTQRFEAHERFFTDEIYRWACPEFTSSIDRNACGIFGFSHGADFVLSVGAKHREKYGVVIAFSVAGGSEPLEESVHARRPAPRYYLSAGSREKPIRARARALARSLSRHGIENTCTERSAGHDFGFWNSELPIAIRWSFTARG